MKIRGKITIFFLAFLFFGGFQAQAAPPDWKFDKDHSSLYFGVKHIFSTVKGYFEDYSGTFLFDPDNLAESKIKIEVKVKSILTNSRKRDDHLRSNEFFDVKNYPLMTFESTSIQHDKDDQYRVAGKLTIKDVSKDIVLPFTFHGIKENPFNPKELVAGFDSKLTIDRFDYNVGTGKFYEMGVVDKDVKIKISLEMLRNK